MIKDSVHLPGLNMIVIFLMFCKLCGPLFRKRISGFGNTFADDEIGALCYKGDGLGYVVINTSLPKVNTNFAISHEIYHVFWGENEFVSKVEFSDDHYYEHEEEYAANLLLGCC